MDAARALFELYRDGGYANLQRAEAEEREEDLLLDFKTVEGNAAPLKKSDRQTLAEALSGFANSDGGVIVWGVSCRSHGTTDPDTAKSLEPIQNLKLLVSNLQRDTPQIVSPGIIGVEHFPIEEPGSVDKGFVITFVPRGEGEPHMARAKDQHRHYYRSGASFLPMESFMLADRYGRRPQPKLEFTYRFERGGASTDPRGNIRHKAFIVIGVRNTGLGVALYPALRVLAPHDFPPARFGLDGNGNTGLPERAQTGQERVENGHFFVGGANHVIHPTTTLDVTRLEREIPSEELISQDISIGFGLHCQAFSASGELTIPACEFIVFVRAMRGA